MVWNIPTKDPVLFLTFDDGPIPQVTPWVLDTLEKYNAKATFFCIGENVQKNPHIYQNIIADGHGIGNHTFNHLNGWKTKTKKYLENITQCNTALNIKPQTSNPKPFFRPPYGKITPSQYSIINKQYSIILWDVLTKDWKQNFTGYDCFKIIKTRAKPGSIIVFHDSLKAEKKMMKILPPYLDHFAGLGYSFRAL